MSDRDKLSSEQVPIKFAEWLLSMGCPPEKVPTVDKVVEMCRGQYYMVWRSLMEHVEPKDVIRQKRLHVFCDDVYKWKRKNAFNKPDPSTVMPAELLLWHQHNDMKEKVAGTEERLLKARQNLDQLMEKISDKLSQRNLSRQSVQNLQRRVWLLQQVTDELKTRKENLEETKSIANSLCSAEEEVDVQSKLERYILSTRRSSSQGPSTSMLASNPVASSSVVSNGDVNDHEEPLSWLLKCRGDALWPHLLERRAALAPALAGDEPGNKDTNEVLPQSVVTHTAAMHCLLALEALKNRQHIKQTRQRLAAAVTDLNAYLSGESCELLVVLSERARSGARVSSLRALLADVTSRGGPFAAPGGDAGDRGATARQIATLDRAIENKKEELKRLVSSLATTEKKIYNVRECLINIFNGFNKDLSLNDNDKLRGQLEFPQESVAALRQFYEDRRERRRRRVDLSMDLDMSEHASFTDCMDNGLKFADELRIYLKEFNLEKNRKLVLESGDKIWSFETVSSAVSRLHSRWQASGAPCVMLCPSTSLARSLHTLIAIVKEKGTLHNALEASKSSVEKQNVEIDITRKSEEEQAIVDRTKKRLNENVLHLQKTSKTLELGQENLRFWAANDMRKMIARNRLLDGKCYKDFEDLYIMNMN